MNEDSIFASLDQDQIIEEDCDLKKTIKEKLYRSSRLHLLPDQ